MPSLLMTETLTLPKGEREMDSHITGHIIQDNMDPTSTGVRPVTVSEALKVIPVSREFFYRAIKSGKLPSYRLGRRVLVDVNECLAAMRVQE